MKTEKLEEGEEKCDFCGRKYDSNCEGHEHFAGEGGCECKYCLKSKALAGTKFCSPECECHYIYDHNLTPELL